ncbi:receptor/regulator protein [Salmonella enterica subsp. enterica]|nr:receptor/regulator protein [Salmonella enterica subsp. enterica]
MRLGWTIFQKDIDDRANLTLSNRFELLLFRLGTSLHEQKSELFGINVFKAARNRTNARLYAPGRHESAAIWAWSIFGIRSFR